MKGSVTLLIKTKLRKSRNNEKNILINYEFFVYDTLLVLDYFINVCILRIKSS